MDVFHARLGEGLFLIYFIVMAVVFFLGRRGRTAPSWLVGLAHGLLALQVALGVILLLEDPDRITWVHPLLGLAAMLSLGLAPVFRRRFGPRDGLIATLGVVGVLALAAMLVANG